jgi:hypothetical protein
MMVWRLTPLPIMPKRPLFGQLSLTNRFDCALCRRCFMNTSLPGLILALKGGDAFNCDGRSIATVEKEAGGAGQMPWSVDRVVGWRMAVRLAMAAAGDMLATAAAGDTHHTVPRRAPVRAPAPHD